MSTIAQLALQVQNRLEENADGVGVFWNVANEVNPAIVEGMNEAAMITGDPEVRPNTFLTLQTGGNVPGAPPYIYQLPADAFLLVRIDAVGQGSIKKVLVGDLDRLQPGWEGQTGRQIKRWFPIGMTMFGVWPQLTGPQQVRITYVGFPTTDAYPYSGSDVSPFREEYNDGFVEYAAHVCRLKESTVEFQESIAQYQSYLDKMVSLTKFAARRGISRFTRIGRQTKLNDIAIKS